MPAVSGSTVDSLDSADRALREFPQPIRDKLAEFRLAELDGDMSAAPETLDGKSPTEVRKLIFNSLGLATGPMNINYLKKAGLYDSALSERLRLLDKSIAWQTRLTNYYRQKEQLASADVDAAAAGLSDSAVAVR
jgi:hypothetical protein